MIDLNESIESNGDKEGPKYSDVVGVFNLLSCQIIEARQWLQVFLLFLFHHFYPFVN